MWRWSRYALRAALSCVAAMQLGCAEVVAPRAVVADLEFVLPSLRHDLPAARVEMVSHPDDPRSPSRRTVVAADGIPPELDAAAALHRYYSVAGFTDDAHIAFGSSVMWYHANRAVQTVDLTLRHNGSEVTSTSGLSEDSYWLPGNHSMYTQATLGIGGECGHAVHARGTHRVWNEFITSNQGLLSWQPQAASSNDNAAQTPCLNRGGPTGGGGWEDGTLYICYYYDWYDYLGSFLFREWLHCVPLNAE